MNLPDKTKLDNTALALFDPKPGVKAVQIRRQMVQMPQVNEALNKIEKEIFLASTKVQISEMSDSELVEKTSIMFRFIAIDVGYIIPNKDDWTYIQTRLLDILKRYYSQLTLADIKLAFELATTGELDEFLPKDSQGNPDRKHYQQFNADYFSKILGAYKRKLNTVIHKAYKALPSRSNMTNEKIEYYRKLAVYRCKYAFLKYKYTGDLSLGYGGEMTVYDWLEKVGLADEIMPNREDRITGYNLFMGRVVRGLVNRYTAFHVRQKGIDSPEIDFDAYSVARRKEIQKAFDRMINKEIQIDNYISIII